VVVGVCAAAFGFGERRVVRCTEKAVEVAARRSPLGFPNGRLVLDEEVRGERLGRPDSDATVVDAVDVEPSVVDGDVATGLLLFEQQLRRPSIRRSFRSPAITGRRVQDQ